MPAWFQFEHCTQTIFAKEIWKRSAEHCKGLFALSEHVARSVRHETGLPVSTLLHPSEIPSTQFDFGSFEANPRKKVVQVGWWLRNLNAIVRLPIARGNPLGYQKVRLVPQFF